MSVRNGTATSPREAEVAVTRPDGLTDAEGKVMDAALEIVRGYAALPVEHPNDMADICDAVHRVQDLLAVRIARRAFPAGWPRKDGATK